jgi:hypothetical protein
MIRVFRDREVYEAELEMFNLLRSRFVANLLEQWEDEKHGYYFLVCERGMTTMAESLLELVPGDTLPVQANLIDMSNLWIFMYENGCRADQLQPKHLMSSTAGARKQWKVFNFEGVRREDRPREGHSEKVAHPVICSPEVAHRIMAKDHSYCKLAEEQTLDVTLGTLLLELLCIHPFFSKHDYYELCMILEEAMFDPYVERKSKDKLVLDVLGCVLGCAKKPIEKPKEIRRVLAMAHKMLGLWSGQPADETPRRPGMEKVNHAPMGIC